MQTDSKFPAHNQRLPSTGLLWLIWLPSIALLFALAVVAYDRSIQRKNNERRQAILGMNRVARLYCAIRHKDHSELKKLLGDDYHFDMYFEDFKPFKEMNKGTRSVEILSENAVRLEGQHPTLDRYGFVIRYSKTKQRFAVDTGGTSGWYTAW